jgi:Nif-specific regulatory protein
MNVDPLLPYFKDILEAISTGRDLREVLPLILDRACELAGARHGSLIQIDRPTQSLLILCTSGEGWSEGKMKTRLKIGEGVTGTVAQTGKPYVCANTEKDPRCVVLFPEMKSEIAVPVVIDREPWAVINMDSEQYSAFDEKTAEALSAFAETVSFAIQSRIKPG